MTASAHAIVAGAIATRFSDPLTAGTLALVSHYVMDSVPHWDLGTNWRARSKAMTGMLAIADTVIAITIAYFLFGRNASLLSLTVALAASLVPDWIETPWYIFFARQHKQEPPKTAGFFEKLCFAVYKMPNMFHTKAQFPLGVLTQIATVLFFLILLK